MSDIMKTIKENDVKFVDLRFTDPKFIKIISFFFENEVSIMGK